MTQPTRIAADELSTWLDEPRSVPPAKQRLASYAGRIVEAATGSGVRGAWHPSAVRCRRRPGRRRCKGLLGVLAADVPNEVRWRCPVCADRGVVTGWRGTMWDLTAWAQAHDEITLVLERAHYQVVDDVYWLDEVALAVVRGAESTPHGIRLAGSVDAMDALFDALASEAEQEDRRRRARVLHAICDLLDDALKGTGTH